MTQPQDKMRAEFEAFVKSEEYDLDLQTDAPGGRYIKGCAGFAWEFWQAACAQQSAQSQQDARTPMTVAQIEALSVWKKFVGLWPETREEITRAIEAEHGITVIATQGASNV